MKAPGTSQSISARFGAAANTYDFESAVQREVAEKLSAMLSPSGAVGSVLEIGCGTGFFTELLINRFPLASIDAVDISGPMIDSARKRVAQCARVRFHTSDINRFCPGGKYALIASSSALHWMTPLGETIKRISSMLEPRGSLASALMVEGTLAELHGARTRLFPHKAAPVRLPSVEEILEAIAAAGLTTGEFRVEERRQTCASARELLRSLNRQGVTGRQQGCRGLLNRAELLELSEYYDRRFSAPDGGVIATYRVLYVTARNEK